MECHEKHFLLLLHHNSQLALLFPHMFHHFFILFLPLHILQVFRFVLELLHAENIALNFVINYLHGGVTDLVRAQDFVELREI